MKIIDVSVQRYRHGVGAGYAAEILVVQVRTDEEITDEGVFLLPPEGPGLGLVLDPEVAERSLVRE